MTNTIIYGAIGFILGGIAGGYLMGRHVAKQSERAIEALKKTNASLVAKACKERSESLAEREKAIEKAEEKVSKKYDVIRKELDSQAEKKTEEKKKPEPEEIEDDEDEDEEDDAADIYVITPEAYRQDWGFRESETLTYYKEDGILVDSVDKPIKNPEFVIGNEGMEAVAEDDIDYVYISNEIDNRLYEVFIDDQHAYYRDVLGQV